MRMGTKWRFWTFWKDLHHRWRATRGRINLRSGADAVSRWFATAQFAGTAWMQARPSVALGQKYLYILVPYKQGYLNAPSESQRRHGREPQSESRAPPALLQGVWQGCRLSEHHNVGVFPNPARRRVFEQSKVFEHFAHTRALNSPLSVAIWFPCCPSLSL
jgi:hypothetical protein